MNEVIGVGVVVVLGELFIQFGFGGVGLFLDSLLNIFLFRPRHHIRLLLRLLRSILQALRYTLLLVRGFGFDTELPCLVHLLHLHILLPPLLLLILEVARPVLPTKRNTVILAILSEVLLRVRVLGAFLGLDSDELANGLLHWLRIVPIDLPYGVTISRISLLSYQLGFLFTVKHFRCHVGIGPL